MDGEFISLDDASDNEDADEHKALAITEAGQHRVESCNGPSAVSHNNLNGPHNIHESFVSGLDIALEHKLLRAARARAPKKTNISAYLTSRPPSKRHKVIFLFSQYRLGFLKNAPQCGSICI